MPGDRQREVHDGVGLVDERDVTQGDGRAGKLLCRVAESLGVHLRLLDERSEVLAVLRGGGLLLRRARHRCTRCGTQLRWRRALRRRRAARPAGARPACGGVPSSSATIAARVGVGLAGPSDREPGGHAHRRGRRPPARSGSSAGACACVDPAKSSSTSGPRAKCPHPATGAGSIARPRSSSLTGPPPSAAAPARDGPTTPPSPPDTQHLGDLRLGQPFVVLQHQRRALAVRETRRARRRARRPPRAPTDASGAGRRVRRSRRARRPADRHEFTTVRRRYALGARCDPSARGRG